MPEEREEQRGEQRGHEEGAHVGNADRPQQGTFTSSRTQRTVNS